MTVSLTKEEFVNRYMERIYMTLSKWFIAIIPCRWIVPFLSSLESENFRIVTPGVPRTPPMKKW